MKFDVIFLDLVAPSHYDTTTLDTSPLGGTEATVIRIAEGMASRGLKVGVINKNTGFEVIGQGAYYLPLDYLTKVQPKNFVSLRGTHALEMFPDATKFSWHHDMPDQRMADMYQKLAETNTSVVAVSNFHKNEVLRWLEMGGNSPTKPVKVHVLYNPIDPRIDVPRELKMKYDRDSMVWAASPHKGLDKALEQFKILKSFIPSMRLRVFNPGYLNYINKTVDGVEFVGARPCHELWQAMSESLCVFYPTDFIETFGLIAAESNAVHTPIATMGIGALNETVQTPNQLVDRRDYPGLLKLVDKWYTNPKTRPDVTIQPRFRLSEVVDQWLTKMSL